MNETAFYKARKKLRNRSFSRSSLSFPLVEEKCLLKYTVPIPHLLIHYLTNNNFELQNLSKRHPYLFKILIDEGLIHYFSRACEKIMAKKIDVIFPYMVEFSRIDFSKIRCLVFDLNNTLTPDFFVDEHIKMNLLKMAFEHELLSAREEKIKLLRSISCWGGEKCIYKEGAIMLKEGMLLFLNDGEEGVVLDKDGNIIGKGKKPTNTKDFFVVSNDPYMIIRTLLMRRGMSKEEAERLHIEAYCSVAQQDKLFLPSFNGNLKHLFINGGKKKIMYIVSNNREKVVRHFCEKMGLQDVIAEKRIISEAEKSVNYARILSDIANRHYLNPEEILVVGDSAKEDVMAAKQWAEEVKTILITLGRSKSICQSLEMGAIPNIASPTLNDAISYLVNQ
jgi:predicted HAD superfamily phosphohydrolase YqeG